ncbi:MAG: hypothetical protein OEV49_06795 [candidate division Zixibacteria bacterium]|nr:hypothetical protein [candidate division Zixibacteria bacterium]MDH3935744.1 hypothetical protein [candidate division Zixibacteria bacterium]MDH4033873.1 hypothetical protein [candidate division Zixibacteria bacterium]
MRRNLIALAAALVLLPLAGAIDSVVADTNNEEINWQVTPGGGTVSSSADYFLRGTAGQTAAGNISGEGISLRQGYWQDFETASCCIGAIRGNVDYDPGDNIDISDVIYMVDFMFTGGPTPICFEEADTDGDFVTELNVADLVYLVDFIFLGGPAPPPCP